MKAFQAKSIDTSAIQVILVSGKRGSTFLMKLCLEKAQADAVETPNRMAKVTALINSGEISEILS